MRFRELLRLKNILTTFSDFKEGDLNLPEQSFEDYKSKYLDVHDKVKKDKEPEKVSVLEEIDFELSLIHRDEINVAYILSLLMGIHQIDPKEAKKRQKEIMDMVSGEVQLRSKRQLIEEFIEQNLPKIKPEDNVVAKFEAYWDEHKEKAFQQLCLEEKIAPEQLKKLLQNYQFANRFPRNQEIKAALAFEPKILESKSILERVSEKIKGFIDTYIEGMGGST